MKDINQLIPDIYELLDSPNPFSEETVKAFGEKLGRMLAARLSEQREGTKLRLSNWDAPCERQLYLKINAPHLVEKLPPKVRLKFLLGDISEEVILFLAEQAGHSVTGEQDELTVAGIGGHRDAVIDGRTVDVKTASPFGFKKFASNGLREDDPFGYVGQLGSYVEAGRGDDLVTDKSRGSFLAQNKVSGELTLDTYHFKADSDIQERMEAKKKMLASPKLPPRAFQPEPMGKAGNMKLPTPCSYCPVKAACYPELRAFAYSTGPVFLTTVVDLPRVPEIPIDSIDS